MALNLIGKQVRIFFWLVSDFIGPVNQYTH